MLIKSSRKSYSIDFVTATQVQLEIEGASAIVTDSNLQRLYPELFTDNTFVFPAGESSKSFKTYHELVTWLAKLGVKRNGKIVAVGGGVTGDLAGFAAATYMRGIEFSLVPTSLLAMVDSSIGGKVGIDMPEGKNLIGAFWPPSRVLISIDFLKTLPEREMLAGSAEAWKAGAIADSNLFDELSRAGDIRKCNLPSVIKQSIQIKAQIVAEDEFESSGLRAILNFGHTIGHAIESYQNYSDWSHGEAVAAGMVLESQLGEKLGVTQKGIAQVLREALQAQGLPTDLPQNINIQKLIDFMKLDKKATSNNMSFSLLECIGRCKLINNIQESDIRSVLLQQ